MKKFYLLLAVLLFSASTFAQSVGINSTGAAPTSGAMLEVVQTGTSETAYFKSSNEDGYGLHIRTVDNGNDKYALKVDTENGEIEGLTVTNAGNVGIGTATPESTLEVAGRVVIDNTVAPGFYGQANNENKVYVGYDGAGTGLQLYNFTSEKSLMVENDGDLTYPGNVGIGTTSPSYKLDISSGDNCGIRIGPNTTWGRSLFLGGWNDSDFTEARIQSSNGNLHLDAKGETSGSGVGIYLNYYHSGDVILAGGGGNVGIGSTELNSYKFYVNGPAGGTGTWNQLSDTRLKKDVVNINNGLEKVMQLRPVTFNWKQEDYPDMNLDDRNHVGFIAQEVEEVVPQVVSTAGDEMQTKSIAYSDLVPVLTKAIQEQQAEIEALKAQNAMLAGKVTELDQLKAEVENLKKSLGLGTQLTDNK